MSKDLNNYPMELNKMTKQCTTVVLMESKGSDLVYVQW